MVFVFAKFRLFSKRHTIGFVKKRIKTFVTQVLDYVIRSLEYDNYGVELWQGGGEHPRKFSLVSQLYHS